MKKMMSLKSLRGLSDMSLFCFLPSTKNKKKIGIESEFVHSLHVIWLSNKMRTT